MLPGTYPSIDPALQAFILADMASARVTAFRPNYPIPGNDQYSISASSGNIVNANYLTGLPQQSVAAKAVGLKDIFLKGNWTWTTEDVRNFLNDALAQFGLPPCVLNPMPFWNI